MGMSPIPCYDDDMAKARTQFLCNKCGSLHAKWLGKCPDCGAWDSLEEYMAPAADDRKSNIASGQASEAIALADIEQADTPRQATGISEFDRVLGGGIVPGSAILVGGEPGIGKSTLLLQVAGAIAAGGKGASTSQNGATSGSASAGGSDQSSLGGASAGDVPGGGMIGKAPSRGSTRRDPATKVLYVTSEESVRQTALRANRLGIDRGPLLVLAETNVERIIHQIAKHQPSVAIIDSIQMIYKPQLPAAPGSVTQLRDCCMELVYLAKSTGTTIIFVGHVTKEGTIAGPRIIEHIVDTVVYFEGDRHHAHRIVRCVKNRFGSTQEIGLFEMTGNGLEQVLDPRQLFVEQYAQGHQPSGSVITAAMQGSRILLLEVQALTASSVIGAARRKVSGVSADRVAMIIAVLEKRCEMRLAAEDVFINVAGGVKATEPAIDLAIALAIASAHQNKPLPPAALAVGELGLGGEVRPVPQLELRLREASRLGVTHAIVPKIGGGIPKLNGMALHEIRRLSQAMADL